jgi:hypothetical protein
MSPNAVEVQTALNAKGYGPLKVDGNIGPATKAAIKKFQAANNLMPDGIAGTKTRAALGLKPPVNRDAVLKKAPKSLDSQKDWPRQQDVVEFFGTPANPRCTAGKVVPPVAMYYGKQVVRSFACHELVEKPMQTIFDETVRHFGEAEFRRLRLDQFSGCFNPRKMRGGSSWSMHSWGIAVDLDQANNQLNWGRDKALFAKPEYIPFWNIVEGQGALSLGRARNFDWMHFQFARL